MSTVTPPTTMSTITPPIIPDRTSSKQSWTSRNLSLRASRDELKRKLSTTSFEQARLEHAKLRVSELETLRDIERHEKEWLDLQREEETISTADYKKCQRDLNQRIVSLGNEVWKASQTLRAVEEEEGLKPTLGPDSDGAFVAALLKLYIDPTTTRKRSRAAQAQMRTNAVERYNPSADAVDGQWWCPVTKDYFEPSRMKAAHIVPSMIGPEIADYIFGAGSGSRLFSADNCLLLHSFAEEHFDKGHFVIIPADLNEKPIITWKIMTTNDDARNADMGRTKLNKLEGTNLVFKNNARPAARFLYYHFVVTLLRNKLYRTTGYAKYMENLTTGKPFATMGAYLRKSLLLMLARKAGDLDEDEEKLIMGFENTFEGKESLDAKEEAEIARRALQEPDDESSDEEDEN